MSIIIHSTLFSWNSCEFINQLKSSKLCQWKFSVRYNHILFSSRLCSAGLWLLAVIQTHAAYFKALFGSLPLCELQLVFVLNHVKGIYTTCHLDVMLRVYFLSWQNTSGSLSLQLFRRVAAALPGMDTTQDKSREDSILCVSVCHDRGGSGGLPALLSCPSQDQNLVQGSYTKVLSCYPCVFSYLLHQWRYILFFKSSTYFYSIDLITKCLQ